MSKPSAEKQALSFKEQFQGMVAQVKNRADRLALIEEITDWMWELHPFRESMPVARVKWVSIDQVEANDWNPNSVAKNEMRLLYTSIAHDGYTQPVVTVFNPDNGKFTVIDGFHRYSIMRSNTDIREKTEAMLPIVVLEMDINDRMASTVRHNRARGKHAVDGMAQMVFQMLENGWEDAQVCAELGLSADELLRLKHVTGFSKLFENVEYRRAWETRRQIQIKLDYKKGDSVWLRTDKARGDRKAQETAKRARALAAVPESSREALAAAINEDLGEDAVPVELVEAAPGSIEEETFE